mmetsp:Transcript_30076/g.87963  ORF Transcript_30076/g.87963 Transcript_30076/m.87963 type:complete len:229 (+) Transcript_30076:670-1356(+)
MGGSNVIAAPGLGSGFPAFGRTLGECIDLSLKVRRFLFHILKSLLLGVESTPRDGYVMIQSTNTSTSVSVFVHGGSDPAVSRSEVFDDSIAIALDELRADGLTKGVTLSDETNDGIAVSPGAAVRSVTPAAGTEVIVNHLSLSFHGSSVRCIGIARGGKRIGSTRRVGTMRLDLLSELKRLGGVLDLLYLSRDAGRRLQLAKARSCRIERLPSKAIHRGVSPNPIHRR